MNDMNTGRQKNIDYAKALAIVFMILIHVMMFPHSNLLNRPIGFLFDPILGGYLAAPVFMLSMGVGMAYSKNQSPDKIIRRGVTLFILAYILNLVRSLVILINLVITRPSDMMEKIIERCLLGDILSFAGLAFIFMGLLKKLKCSDLWILIISFILNITFSLIPEIITEHQLIAVSVGLIIPIQFKEDFQVCFPLFTWFVFVASGYCFGIRLKKIKNLDLFYMIAGLLGVFITVVMIVIKNKWKQIGLLTSFKEDEYFNHIVVALLSIGIVIVEYAVLYFITKKSSEFLDKFVYKMSNSVNEIYMISWVIIFNINYLFLGILFPNDHPAWVFAILFVTTTIPSVFLGIKWKEYKARNLSLFPR